MIITPISGSLGAEVSGIDPSSLSSEEVIGLRSAVVEHEVVF